MTDEWSNFKFQGRCYHRIGPLRPEDGDDRRWAQWYIHDGTAEEEAQGRIDSMPEGSRCRLKKETVKVLQEMLHLRVSKQRTFTIDVRMQGFFQMYTS